MTDKTPIEPIRSILEVVNRYPDYPWTVVVTIAGDLFDYRVVRVASTVDKEIVIWAEPFVVNAD